MAAAGLHRHRQLPVGSAGAASASRPANVPARTSHHRRALFHLAPPAVRERQGFPALLPGHRCCQGPPAQAHWQAMARTPVRHAPASQPVGLMVPAPTQHPGSRRAGVRARPPVREPAADRAGQRPVGPAERPAAAPRVLPVALPLRQVPMPKRGKRRKIAQRRRAHRCRPPDAARVRVRLIVAQLVPTLKARGTVPTQRALPVAPRGWPPAQEQGQAPVVRARVRHPRLCFCGSTPRYLQSSDRPPNSDHSFRHLQARREVKRPEASPMLGACSSKPNTAAGM